MVLQSRAWTEERTGGQLSADKISSRVNAYSCGKHRFYTVKGGGANWIIGGVPEASEEYIEAARGADRIVLLTARPEFAQSLSAVLEVNPDIRVYASAAGLRNIKEIVNTGLNEQLVKDGMEEDGIRFLAAPGLCWMDSVIALADGVLFSGELFSGFDGSAVGLKRYYEENLAVNSGFVRSVLEKLSGKEIRAVCPAYGMTCPQGSVCLSAEPEELTAKYMEWSKAPRKNCMDAVIIFASRYGYTRSMAECAAELLKERYRVTLLDAVREDREKLVSAVNSADILLIGTNTENRNAPRAIWDAVTALDLVNKRGMRYLVFGSFGWAGDGMKLIDSTLSSMGMKRAAKPVDVLLRPDESDFMRLKKAVQVFLEE